MLIQKTFHLGMKKEVARERLFHVREYRHELPGVELAVTAAAAEAVHFAFRLAGGVRARVELVRAEGDNPAQTLFRSRDGNLDVLGVLEFFEIKPDLTEVVLTLDYSFRSPVFQAVDYLLHGMERFIDRQIGSIEAHFARPVAGFRADRDLPTPINGTPLYADEE